MFSPPCMSVCVLRMRLRLSGARRAVVSRLLVVRVSSLTYRFTVRRPNSVQERGKTKRKRVPHDVRRAW